MSAKVFFRTTLFTMLLTSFLLSACTAPTAPAISSAIPTTSVSTAAVTTAVATPTSSKPDWFNVPLTDVRTGKTFTIDDFAGKVVLIQTINEWCSNCAYQQHEVTTLNILLGNRDDLVSISLDVDRNEDAASLKKYVDHFGFDWRFAVAPLEVTSALGNLYSAEYLNPPLEPMLIIDRSGNVYGLPYGFKSANALGNTLAPYLQ
jgi:cytochrome oxidase Cu insertion factor (SCO1/SenC/PrrC family)